jgi:hypothetical protein
MMYSNGRIFKSSPDDLNLDDILDGTEESVVGKLEDLDLLECEGELDMVVDGKFWNRKVYEKRLKVAEKRDAKVKKNSDKCLNKP